MFRGIPGPVTMTIQTNSMTGPTQQASLQRITTPASPGPIPTPLIPLHDDVAIFATVTFNMVAPLHSNHVNNIATLVARQNERRADGTPRRKLHAVTFDAVNRVAGVHRKRSSVHVPMTRVARETLRMVTFTGRTEYPLRDFLRANDAFVERGEVARFAQRSGL